VLNELRVLEQDDLRDLVELYFADVAVQLAAIQTAFASNDPGALGAAAHRIKGASLSIGAERVAGLAAELETAAKAGELSGTEALVASIERDLDPTQAALRQEFSLEPAG
jgi:HPt (histidine-containing phosphotransfer) domain-containing protein